MMNRSDAKERVRHPGAVLFGQFMKPLGISINRLATELRLSQARVSLIVNERRGITVDTAMRLSRLFSTSVQYWIQLQAEYDIQQIREQNSEGLDAIRPFSKKVLEPIDPSIYSLSFAPDFVESEEAQPAVPYQNVPVNELSEEMKYVYELLSDKAIHFDILCETSGRSAGELSAALTMLELENLVQRDFGNRYSRCKPHQARKSLI
jgi:antitoxin HigA-1